MITEIATNLYGLIGVGIGSATGLAIAVLNRKWSKAKTENNEIAELKKSLSKLETKFNGLKNGFNLVYDEMERRGELPVQLKDFKKMFDL